MKPPPRIQRHAGRRILRCGYTLPEVLIATTLGALVVAAATVGSVFTLRSFVTMFNYTDMDINSSLTLDRMSKDIRGASALIGLTNTASAKALVFSGLNESGSNITISYKWDSASKQLVCSKTGEEDQTYLTGCSSWDFTLDQRTPATNYGFYTITNSVLSECKLVDMTWKCNRSLLGQAETETIETAKIVLRN